MRSFRPLTWLLIGFLLALASCTAFAETIPSTSSTDTVNPTTEYQAVCGPPGCPWAASPTAACAAIAGHTAPYDGVSKCVQTSPSYDWWSVAQRSSCPSDYALAGGVCTKTVYSCPSGYALSEDQQTCTKSVCKAGTKLDSGMYTDSDGNGITKRACLQGCWGDFKGTGPYAHYSFNSQEYSNVYIGDYIADGSECTQSTPTETEVTSPPEQTQPTDTPEYDCASQGMTSGTVNGVVVCMPAGTPDAPPVQSPDNKTETNPDGSRTQTTNRDTVDGDSVTRETTTTQYDANGNVVSQSTSTTNASTGAFCELNPNSEVCKKSTVSGGEGCDVAPVCSGDAAACAILRQQWEARCEIKKQNDFVAEPGPAGVFESKTSAIDEKKTDLRNLIEQIRGEAAGLFTFSGAGNATLGCDAGVTTTQGFHVELCFSKYDSELTMIGSVLVFVSLVIAVFIMFS